MGKVLQEEELHVSKALKVDPVMCLLRRQHSVFIDWCCQSGISCAFAGGCNIRKGWVLRKSSATELKPWCILGHVVTARKIGSSPALGFESGSKGASGTH